MSDSTSRRFDPYFNTESEGEGFKGHTEVPFASDPLINGIVHWSWEVPTSVVLYSREWRHVLLRPDDEAVQTTLSSWWPLMHEDDVQPFLEVARDIAEGLTDDYQTLFRVQRADGKWAWLLSRGKVVKKRGQTPLLVRGTIVDVSFLREDIKFLHGSADMNSPHRHIMPQKLCNIAGSMGVASPPLPDKTKKNSLYLCPGMRVFYDSEDALPGDMGDKQNAFIRSCIDSVFTDGLALRETISFETNYGHTVTGEYFFWPEFDATGKVIAVTTQFWDLTDKILSERRAKLNEMRLDALHQLTQMSSLPEDDVLSFVMDSLVKLTGSTGGFLYFPAAHPDHACRMVWSQNHYDILGTENLPSDMLPEDLEAVTTDDRGTPYQRIIRNGNCLQPVWTLFNGKIKVLRYIAAPVFDQERVVCIAGVHDKEDAEYLESDLLQLESFVYGAWLVLRRHEFVRELERAKESAEQAREAAERANKIKDKFLANVSHELRTPLNGMLGMLQLLEILPLTEQQREYIRMANVSGQALLRIIADILDFARIDSGKMRLQIEPFDFKSVFESSLSLFRKEAEERGICFEISVDERIPRRMLGDDARLRQILFNIVGNALKFTERGSIRVACSLLPHGGTGHVWVYISVQDTGIGIPLEEQSRIFDAFTQIDSSSTKKYSGTGLGLSIVRHLVALMGGGISLESEEGEGTTIHSALRFSRLPATLWAPEPPGLIRVEKYVDPLCVLVVDDDDISRYTLQIFLQHLGHTPVCVPNGRLALEMLQLYPFHCLFTDIQMPDMDGMEVVRRIRTGSFGDIVPTDEARELLKRAIPGGNDHSCSVPKDIVAVTVSAHTMRGDKERFLESGMDFYIAKPVLIKDLVEVLCEVSRRGSLSGRMH